jgi:hypothetical protein
LLSIPLALAASLDAGVDVGTSAAAGGDVAPGGKSDGVPMGLTGDAEEVGAGMPVGVPRDLLPTLHRLQEILLQEGSAEAADQARIVATKIAFLEALVPQAAVV